MSSEIARREAEPLVPGTPESLSEARDELVDLVNQYNPVQRLETYSDALNYIDNASNNDHYFILHLKPKDNQLIINAFPKNQSKKANDKYLEIEVGLSTLSEEEAVLVSVDSISSLKEHIPIIFWIRKHSRAK